MNKTHKKLDKLVVKALTDTCEYAKYEIDGFEWITHKADYSGVPYSLDIVCVFTTKKCIEQAKSVQNDVFLIKYIQQALTQYDVDLKKTDLSVRFDSEEQNASGRLL